MKKTDQNELVQDEYKKICIEMTKAGYVENVHVFSKTKTTVLGILIPFFILILILGPLYKMLNGATTDFELSYPLFFLIAVISLMIHELIHGITWSIGCKHGWKSIDFGLTGFIPYCHCKELLNTGNYLLGVLMPFLVLGFGITMIAFILSNMWLLLTAVVNIFLAGGDLLIAFGLIRCKNAKIIDHPTAPGFVAFSKC